MKQKTLILTNPNKGNFSAEEMDAIINNTKLYSKEKAKAARDEQMGILALKKYCEDFTKYKCAKITKSVANKRKENNCLPLKGQ